MRRAGTGGLVYSTDGGRMCPACRQPLDGCRCGQVPAPSGDGIARISRERAGRGGKLVTVVRGLPLDALALAALGKALRAACGCGGTAKDAVLELQGDQLERAQQWLQAEGWQVRRSGG